VNGWLGAEGTDACIFRGAADKSKPVCGNGYEMLLRWALFLELQLIDFLCV